MIKIPEYDGLIPNSCPKCNGRLHTTQTNTWAKRVYCIGYDWHYCFSVTPRLNLSISFQLSGTRYDYRIGSGTNKVITVYTGTQMMQVPLEEYIYSWDKLLEQTKLIEQSILFI
jgi:hypothetical protein